MGQVALAYSQWSNVMLASAGVVVAQLARTVLAGEGAVLTWDAPATSVRFYTISGSTSLDDTQTTAPFALATGNLSAGAHVFGIEVDGVLLAIVTIQALAPLAFVARAEAGGISESSADAQLTGVTNTAITANTEYALIKIVSDNLNEATGDFSDITSVTIGGVAATKIAERTTVGNDDAGAPESVTVSIWILAPTSTIASGAAVVIDYAGNATAKTCRIDKFSKDAATTLAWDFAHAETLGTKTADPPNTSISGLPNAQHAIDLIVGREGGATHALDWTSPLSDRPGPTAGTGGFGSVGCRSAGTVLSGTAFGPYGATDPGANTDYQTILVAIRQVYDGEAVPTP